MKHIQCYKTTLPQFKKKITCEMFSIKRNVIHDKIRQSQRKKRSLWPRAVFFKLSWLEFYFHQTLEPFYWISLKTSGWDWIRKCGYIEGNGQVVMEKQQTGTGREGLEMFRQRMWSWLLWGRSKSRVSLPSFLYQTMANSHYQSLHSL